MNNFSNHPRYNFGPKKFTRPQNETEAQQRNRILNHMRPEIKLDPIRCAKAMKRALEVQNTERSGSSAPVDGSDS